MTTVTGFEQRSDGLWEVKHRRAPAAGLRRDRRTFTAAHLVLAAGTWGTQQLLFKMRDAGKLPKLSDKLGRADPHQLRVDRRRGTSDGASPDLDLTHGVAITSSIHPTSDTHVEPVRYGKGSNAMGLLQTLMTDGAGPRAPMCRAGGSCSTRPREDPRKHAAAAQPARGGASAR